MKKLALALAAFLLAAAPALAQQGGGIGGGGGSGGGGMSTDASNAVLPAARTNLGLGTGDSPTFANVNAGAAGFNNLVLNDVNANQASIYFNDAGASKWQFGRQLSNDDLFIYDAPNGKTALNISKASGNFTLGETSTTGNSLVGGWAVSGSLNVANGISNNGVLALSQTPPTIASGGCTTGSAQSISANNGTAAFEITLGGATCGSTITLTLAAAAHNWQCDGYKIGDLTNYVVSTGVASTTAVVLTNVVRTTGVAGTFTAATKYAVKCLAY